MKKKIIKKIIKYLFILILLILLSVAFYFLFVDRETKDPENISDLCNINIDYFKNRKIFTVSPKETDKTDYTILYFHGGSYMAEATNDYWDFIQKISLDTNSTVIMPDFPLAPKDDYIDVFEMIEPFYNDLVTKVDTNSLIVMGDSSGGGLALSLMEKISECDNPQVPEKIILLSPWLDARLNNPEIAEYQKKDPQLHKSSLKFAGYSYAGGKDGVNSYLVSPIDGDVSKLKNITIFIGTNDIMNPDVHLMKEKAEAQNVLIDIKEYENAGHIWFIENNSDKQLIEKGYNDLLEVICK